MLSLLESCDGLHRSESLLLDTNENIGILREKLSKYVAYGGKLDSSRFMEYWVPVHISNVQLEQYCATLLSKCLLLCSPLKNDPVGALRDILISTRKVRFINYANRLHEIYGCITPDFIFHFCYLLNV